MGTGIAIVANWVAGLNVTILDKSEESLKKSKSFTGKRNAHLRNLVWQGD